MRNRIEVIHGVNLDMLGARPVEHYGAFTLAELEGTIARFGAELGAELAFFQTNHEGEFCERLHRARDMADGVVVNPGAWTHYSYAIRDAIEIAAVPAVEVHISDVSAREEWRRRSVIADVCVAVVAGKGQDGYRDAIELLMTTLAADPPR